MSATPRLPLLLLWSALAGCGGGGDPAGDGADAGVAADAWRRPFDLKSGGGTAGEQGGCDARFCTDEPLDGFPDDARRLFVDPTAAAGGDGSRDRPARDLAAALGLAAGRAAVLYLAPGDYDGPVATAAPLALVGAGAPRTTIRAADGAVVALSGSGAAIVAGLTVTGGRFGLEATGLDRLVIHGCRLDGAAQIGLFLSAVHAAEIRDSAVRGAGLVQIGLVDSALAVRRTIVGPGPGAGIRLQPAADRAPDDCANAHALCPFSGLLALDESLVTGVTGRAVDVERGLLHVVRSRIEGVGRGAGDAAVGLGLAYAFGAFADDSVIADVDGYGVLSESARVLLRDALFTRCASGGASFARRAEHALDLGVDWHPRWEWMPAPDWSRSPDLFAGVDWHPRWEWQPRDEALPVEDHLPAPLRMSADPPAPDRELHRWARVWLVRVAATDDQAFGVRLADHVADLIAPEIRGTRGASSVGLWFDQDTHQAPEEPGFSAVVLSRVVDAAVEGNEGVGVLAARARLWVRVPGQNSEVAAVGDGDEDLERSVGRIRFEGAHVADSAGPGFVVDDGAADLRDSDVRSSVGVGLWSIGSWVRLYGTAIHGVRPGTLVGRAGAVQTADGLVLSGSRVLTDAPLGEIDVRDFSITGAQRVGMLLVVDQASLGGRVIRGEGEIADNGLDAAVIGDLGALQVEGVDVVPRTEAELPVPVQRP